jgi:vacuolar-type H+-ATPase subunit F/Vma7
VVENAAQAAQQLDRLVERGEKAIIITTEQVANSVREKVNEIRFGGAFPLIVEVPGPGGPSEESPSLMRMIREAVGIKF